MNEMIEPPDQAAHEAMVAEWKRKADRLDAVVAKLNDERQLVETLISQCERMGVSSRIHCDSLLMVVDDILEIANGKTNTNPHGPQMARTNKIDLDHSAEGTH